MKKLLTSTTLVIGLMMSAGVYAEAAPAGATGLCKDGSYNTSANKQGACRGHKGIQDWYATPSVAAAAKTAATTAVTTTAPVAMTPKPAKVITTPKVAATTSVTASGAAPSGATGLCKDGSYHTGANKQGACRGHKGIQDWYGPTAAATVAATTAVTAPAAATPAAPTPEKKGTFSFLNKKPTPTTTAAPTATTTTSTNATTATHTAPAAVAMGGGAGKVWVNTESNVYHCEGSHWYGTTKAGSYMTEAAAQAAGARPTKGKACQ